MNRKQRRNAAKKLKANQAVQAFNYPRAVLKKATVSIPVPEGMGEVDTIPVPSFLSPLTKALEGGIRRGDLFVMGALTPPMRGYMSAVKALRQHILNGDVKGTYAEPGLFEISMEAFPETANVNGDEQVVIQEDIDRIIQNSMMSPGSAHQQLGRLKRVPSMPNVTPEEVQEHLKAFIASEEAEGRQVWPMTDASRYIASLQAFIDAKPKGPDVELKGTYSDEDGVIHNLADLNLLDVALGITPSDERREMLEELSALSPEQIHAGHAKQITLPQWMVDLIPEELKQQAMSKLTSEHGGSGKIVMITEDPDPANDKNRADIIMDPVSIFSKWGDLPKAEGKIVWDESLDEFHARCQAIVDALPEDHPDKKRDVHMLDIDGDVIGGQFVIPKTRLETEVALGTGVDEFPDVTIEGVVYQVRQMRQSDLSAIHLPDPVDANNGGWRRGSMGLMIRPKPIPAGAAGVTTRPLKQVVSFSLVDPQGDPSIPTIGVRGHFQQDSE